MAMNMVFFYYTCNLRANLISKDYEPIVEINEGALEQKQLIHIPIEIPMLMM